MAFAPPSQNEQVYAAQHVYLLMKKEYRISRNIRALWYLQHLNKILVYTPRKELVDVSEELTVLSVLPKEEDVRIELGHEYRFLITPETIITFISRRYRLVFALDLSPSSASVDLCSGEVLYDQVLSTLQNCLEGLVQPLTLPRSFLILNPEMYVTVIASTPLLTCSTNLVLAQGVLITKDNIKQFIREAKNKLVHFESGLVQDFSKVLQIDRDTDCVGLTGGLFSDIVEAPSCPVPPDILVGPEPCFVNMLRYGILALQLLPENTSAGIIIITDGLVGLPDAAVFESLMVQLRNGTIACSFLRLGSNRGNSCQLGHIPHVELLQFIATATFGAYFSTCPALKDSDPCMNVYHQAFFCWNFQKGLDGFKIEDLPDKNVDELTEDLAWRNSPCVPPSLQGLKWQNLSPVVRKKHFQSTVHASISSVMSLRLREGYTIKDIHVVKNETELVVKLVLPWRDFVRIEYVASTTWPLDQNNLLTDTEIILEGSYEFLHDVTCPMKKPFRSVYRTAVVKKFWNTVQGILQTDQLLVHLQSFSSNPVYYNIPESIKNGVPLFYIQANSSNPYLSVQHGSSSKDNALTQFALFWKPVFMLDINIWQKWMHTHRIGIILEHDTPLPKYLHIPNSSQRFNPIQCRQAHSSLNAMLRDWGSFVLVENHSYIKLLEWESDKPPTSFCLLRVSSKPPCVVLRLAFLGGTPGEERNQFTANLRERVKALKFPQRRTQKSNKNQSVQKLTEDAENVERKQKKPPLMREWSEIHCCVLLSKPVERILIRYECIPKDMMNLEAPYRDRDSVSSLVATPNKTIASMFMMLSRYLYHRRWVWSVKQPSSAPINLQGISKILTTLSNIRLQEGFHFAMSNMGIVTMVLEVDMKRNSLVECPDELSTCIIQYVIFPPYTKTTRGSVSEDDLEEMETTEADGELQIVTECWIEPQSGVVTNSSPERQYMDGLTFQQIPQQFYPIDFECIACLITFQHLVTVCQCFNLTAPEAQLPIYASTLTDGLPYRQNSRGSSCSGGDFNDPSVQYTPFPFDLLSLLPRCQQAEVLFSTYYSDDIDNQQAVNNLLFDLLYEKFKLHHDKEVILSDNDCLNFVKLITQRKRDVLAQPYPFKFTDIFSAEVEDVEIESLDIQESEMADFLQSEASSVSESKDTEKESRVESDISSKDKSSTIGAEKSEGISSYDRVIAPPKWNCLVKVDTTNHLILTFLPASYKDLAILNLVQLENKTKSTDQDEANGLKAEAEQEAVDGDVSGNQDEDGREQLSPLPVDPVSDEAKECSTGDDLQSEFSLSSIKNPSSPLYKKQVKTEIKIEQSPKSDAGHQFPKLKIPIYVYDCYLSNLTNSLVNRWNFELSEDIFEDLSFPSDMDISGAVPLSPRVRMASHELDTVPEFDRDESSDAIKERWKMSLDRRSTDSASDFHGALWQHCIVLGEDYFNCYVTGIFKNLLIGHTVSEEDVEAAITNICEEALPLEVDMTCFLETSCGHLLNQIQKSKREGIAAADGLDTQQSKVRFADLPGETESGSIMEESGETSRSTVPEVLLFPAGSTIRICLADLQLSASCEQIKGLHELIKSKFMEIVKLWFKPIPSYPDYYYYSPEPNMEDSQNVDSTDTPDPTSDTGPEGDMHGIQEEYSDYFASDYEEAGAIDKDFPDHSDGEYSTMSNHGSISAGSEHSFDEQDSLNEAEAARNQPLFLHFTCTLKSKRSHHNVSLRLLPTCLADLAKDLEGLTDLDLGDIKITFDLNCLTLPTDVDFSSLPRRPKYVRMSSHTSASPPQSDVEGDDAVSTTTSHDAFQFRGIDPISHLPKFQKKAVENCKKEIEWLLRDELTSSLRHIYPVTSANLQLVANHVSESVGKPMCLTESIPLKFVFGQEQSLPRFIQELEKMNIEGYRVIKEDQYYYIVIDRARPRNWAHPFELNSKLVELSRECSPAKETHRFSTESDSAAPVMDKQKEISQIISSPDGVFLPEDYSTGKGFEGQEKVDRNIAAIGFAPVDSPNKLLSESPDIRLDESNSNSPAMTLFETIESKDSTPTIKSSCSMMNVQPLTSYPTVTAPSPEEGVIMKRSSSFSGFTIEEQAAPHASVSDMTVQGESPRGALKTVSSASQMAPHSRVKHFSGPSTTTSLSRTSTRPQTPSWVSSTGSCTEGGYEGGSSDPGSDDEVISHTGVLIPSPLHITFWLLFQVHQDKVDVFYHARDNKIADDEESVSQKEVLKEILEKISQSCRIVNQHMLLVDLYEQRMCNQLLVPEADEDVSWRRDSITKHKQPTLSNEFEEDEDETHHGQVCLMDNLKLKPGFFACDAVLKHHFFLHPRIKTGASRSSATSRGVQVLRSRLIAFSVNNRKNMFVIKETATENVFYLRLQDSTVSDIGHGEAGGRDTEDGVSVSSSLRSLANRKSVERTCSNKANQDGEDSETTSGEKEPDTVSVGSSGIMRLDSRQEECIELSVHGIAIPGDEIREELIQILQKKLDDAVLDMISLMLSRNPNSKLSVDDVQFIQQPGQQPNIELLLTVPSSASIPLFALMYYLRQNLQFLNVPKYTDNKGENHFQDIIEDTSEAIPEHNVFFYNTPQGAGGKGIACISLTLVDGQQKSKVLFGCSKASPSAYMDWLDEAMMSKMVETTVYQPSETVGPGPTALIRFRVWARGQVDLDNLTKKLTEALGHALCDIVLEYRLLTTPICEVPSEGDLEEELKVIALSEPLSPPKLVTEGRDRERRLSGLKGLDQGRSPGKTGAPPPSPIQTLFSEFKKKSRSPSAKESPKTFDFPSGPGGVPSGGVSGMTWQEVDMNNQQDSDIKALSMKYEMGERGNLQAKYWHNVIDWLEMCSQKGCPSVHKTEGSIMSRFSVDTVLRELQNSVTQVCSDVKPLIYKLTSSDGGGRSPLGIPYSVNRQPVMPTDPSHESSTDVRYGQVLSTSNQFLMIGRNHHQWKSCLDPSCLDDSANEQSPNISPAPGHKKFSKFHPFEASKCTERLPPEASVTTDTGEAFFAPRQSLLIISLIDKNLCLYTYNWAGDLTALISRLFSRLVQWHSARSHLLNNLIHQKMGLFHHHMLTEPPPTQSTNCFITQNMEIDLLIRSSTPPSRDPPRRQTNSMATLSGSGTFHLRLYRTFECSYNGLKPPKPMHRSSYGTSRDPVTRHGHQTQDIRNHERRDTERAVKLQKLYVDWTQRPGTNLPIAEDFLTAIKQASRLVHYCATPLLLSPKWRLRAMAKPEVERAQSVPVTSTSLDKTETKTRSRHSSATSNTSLKAKRTESHDDKRKSAPTPTTDGTDFRQRMEPPEDSWHIELRSSFLTQYIHYLQSLGFMEVQTRPTSPKRMTSRSSNRRSEEKGDEDEVMKKRSMLTCLQKTLPGGILLMELNFRDVYFCVKLFAYDCSVNSQQRLFFVDECDRYRDLIHVHSFAHDFHLRCIQVYLHGRQVEFKPGYHLAGFLSDFYQVHPNPPSFARNYLREKTLSFPNINTSAEQLYSYMVEHAKLYDMKAVKMTTSISDLETEYEVVRETEQALICQNFHNSFNANDLQLKMDDFDVGLVIVAEGHTILQELEQQVDKNTLRLKYYIIMTSRRDLFPRSHFERRLSIFKTTATKYEPSEKNFVVVSGSPLPYSESFTDLTGLSIGSDSSSSLSIRQPYSGPSNAELQPIINILQHQVQAAEVKIKGMVESSMSQCRRDVLWEKLILCGDGTDEDSKKKKKIDVEDSKACSKLTFVEFTELLKMVTKCPLRQLDDRLETIETMGLSWYHTLAQLLVAKYPQTHRQFVCQDGTVQYVALINPWTNPRKLENFMLLQVDNQKSRAELCIVFREMVLQEDLTQNIVNLSNVQSFVEGFVSTCCFHLWSSLLSS